MVLSEGPSKDMLVQVQTPSLSAVVESTNQPQMFNERDMDLKVKIAGKEVQMPAQNQTIELESRVSLV